jgi:hypothetical protein
LQQFLRGMDSRRENMAILTTTARRLTYKVVPAYLIPTTERFDLRSIVLVRGERPASTARVGCGVGLAFPSVTLPLVGCAFPVTQGNATPVSCALPAGAPIPIRDRRT